VPGLKSREEFHEMSVIPVENVAMRRFARARQLLEKWLPLRRTRHTNHAIPVRLGGRDVPPPAFEEVLVVGVAHDVAGKPSALPGGAAGVVAAAEAAARSGELSAEDANAIRRIHDTVRVSFRTADEVPLIFKR
jgi:hypothetical protein